MDNERMNLLFENMAQYIFEELCNMFTPDQEIKRVFIEELGFTESEYADEIGDCSRTKE